MLSSSESPCQWVQTAAAQTGSVLLATALRGAEDRASYLFTRPMQVLTADNLSDIPSLFAGIELELAKGRHVAGFLSYEAGYHFEPSALPPSETLATGKLPVAWFGVFDKAEVFDSVPWTWGSGTAGAQQPIEVGISRSKYCEAVERIRQYIAAGDFYQANFTIPLKMAWPGGAGPLFERMLANQPVPYGAVLNLGTAQILSASPELFFRRSGSRIVARPMKGTCVRGRDCAEEAQNTSWLGADEKNRAENLMIVDLLRNDLGRICAAGSVRTTELFQVERYPALLQMTSTVTGELRSNVTHYDVFRALFPCGSITGAPKIRAMQVIRELEGEPRGIACGAIGYFAPNGDAEFSVAIRTATLHDGEVHMRVGSGITYDSIPDSEFDECLLKAKFLTDAPEPFELIETLRWDGSYWLLDLHLDRLAASAEYFDFPVDRGKVWRELQEFARELDAHQHHRVRLLLTRAGHVSLSGYPLAPDRRPVRLIVSGERRDAADPFLRHKTTRRTVYDRALEEARAVGFDDALFLNGADQVTECAIHNLLVFRRGEILTPALNCGVLPGVYRRYLLEHHPKLHESVLTMDDLESADRVYVFNSVRGLRRVDRIVPYLPNADTAG